MGIVEGCTSRDKDEKDLVPTFGRDDFENEGLDSFHFNFKFESHLNLEKWKEVKKDV
jgi:hypothetical protein